MTFISSVYPWQPFQLRKFGWGMRRHLTPPPPLFIYLFLKGAVLLFRPCNLLFFFNQSFLKDCLRILKVRQIFDKGVVCMRLEKCTHSAENQIYFGYMHMSGSVLHEAASGGNILKS